MPHCAHIVCIYASTLLQDASFRCRESDDPSIPPKREETRVGGVGIPPSTGINGNRRSNRVFFQLMARMIGDELLEDEGGGERDCANEGFFGERFVVEIGEGLELRLHSQITKEH